MSKGLHIITRQLRCNFAWNMDQNKGCIRLYLLYLLWASYSRNISIDDQTYILVICLWSVYNYFYHKAMDTDPASTCFCYKRSYWSPIPNCSGTFAKLNLFLRYFCNIWTTRQANRQTNNSKKHCPSRPAIIMIFYMGHGVVQEMNVGKGWTGSQEVGMSKRKCVSTCIIVYL